MTVLKEKFDKTIITAHHLFWGHCVKSVVILDQGIFLSEGAQLPKKNTEVQNITDEFTQWPKQRWCKVIIVIDNRYSDILNAF